MRREAASFGSRGRTEEQLTRALLAYLERRYTLGQIRANAECEARLRGATRAKAEDAGRLAVLEELERRLRHDQERARGSS